MTMEGPVLYLGAESTLADEEDTQDMRTDADVSFTDVLNDELLDNEIHDIDEEFVSDKDLNCAEADLCVKAFSAIKMHEQILSNKVEVIDALIEDFTAAIEGLGDLVYEYGNVEALDDLISLMTEMDAGKTPGPRAQVAEILEELAGMNVLPLKNTTMSSETPEQISYELQEQLLQSLDQMLFHDGEEVEAIIEAFKGNPTFTNNRNLEAILT